MLFDVVYVSVLRRVSGWGGIARTTLTTAGLDFEHCS